MHMILLAWEYCSLMISNCFSLRMGSLPTGRPLMRLSLSLMLRRLVVSASYNSWRLWILSPSEMRPRKKLQLFSRSMTGTTKTTWLSKTLRRWTITWKKILMRKHLNWCFRKQTETGTEKYLSKTFIQLWSRISIDWSFIYHLTNRQYLFQASKSNGSRIIA